MNALLLSGLVYIIVLGIWRLWKQHKEQTYRDRILRANMELIRKVERESYGNK